jgi:hypothetical protein
VTNVEDASLSLLSLQNKQLCPCGQTSNAQPTCQVRRDLLQPCLYNPCWREGPLEVLRLQGIKKFDSIG